MRTLAVGCVVAAVAVALSACGSPARTVETGPQALASAYTKSQSQKSADMSMTMNMSSGSAGQILTMTAQGTYQFKPLLGQLNMEEKISGQTIPVTMDLVGTDAFYQVPAAARSQLGGKDWIKISLAQLIPAGDAGGADPTQELAILQSQADAVENLGPQEIDGVTTTEYSAEMDLTKAFGHVTPSPVLQQMLKSYQSLAGTSIIPVKVWIDSAGLPRQMQITERLVNPPAGSASSAVAAYPLTIAVTVSFTNYGVAVDVTPPPAGEVSSLTLQQLLQQEQAAGGGS